MSILISPNTAQQLVGVRDNGGSTIGREHYVPAGRSRRQTRIELFAVPSGSCRASPITCYGPSWLWSPAWLAASVVARETNPVGFDAYHIRTQMRRGSRRGIQVRKTTEQVSARDDSAALQPGGSEISAPKSATLFVRKHSNSFSQARST